MMFIWLFFVCASALTLTAAEETCTEEYKALEQNGRNHSMCLTDSDDVTYWGINDAEAQVLVDEHNAYRRMVSPNATNMAKVYWNAEVARIAQKWANQCNYNHDKPRQRRIPSLGSNAGQTIFLTVTKADIVTDPEKKLAFFTRPVKAYWRKEVDLFTYGEKSPSALHYIQVNNADTMLIGCGYVGCYLRRETSTLDDNWSDELFEERQGVYFSHMVVCNYVNGFKDNAKPYEDGASCAACPNTCDDRLCDCGDKICQNGGTMNMADCTCSCKSDFEGDYCETESAAVGK